MPRVAPPVARDGAASWVVGLLALLVTGGAVAGVAAAVPAGQALVVEDAATGERLLTVPVTTGTTVALEYTHSVERSPVRDVYTVRDGDLVNTRMEFQSYGAGLPAQANVTIENGTFVFDPEGRYDELYVHPGAIAGHRLVVGEESYDLVARSNGETVRVAVATRSALQTLLSQHP